MKKGDRVRVVSNRCPGCFGMELIVLWSTGSMWGCRPVFEANWDGRPLFFTTDELQ